MTYGVNAPLGLQAIADGSSSSWNGSYDQFPICASPNTYATSLFLGDLVTLVGGLVNIYTPANFATVPGLGVFWGCTFTDTNGVVQFQKYWPASTAIKAGTVAVANVITDPATRFTIQSSAAYLWGDIAKNANVTFATAGSTLTGESGMQLNQATIATTNTFPLHVIAFDTIPGNAPTPGTNSGPFPNLIVKINDSFFGNLSLGVV